VTGFDGVQRVLIASEVVHLRYASRDGLFGVSPLDWARASTDLVTAQALLAREQAETGNVPLISFEMDRMIEVAPNDSAFLRVKDQLRKAVHNLRRGEALLLDQGLHANPLSVSGRDAQFHEARVLGLEDVCRAFGVPNSVAGLGRQSSYGSMTEESRSLVRYCIGPWSRLIEDQLKVALLTREERATLSLEHDLSALLRGSTEEEIKSLQAAVGGPFISADEAREWLGFNPTEGGATVRFPMNTAPAAAGGSTES
jgi:HK97 family phage portal protein